MTRVALAIDTDPSDTIVALAAVGFDGGEPVAERRVRQPDFAKIGAGVCSFLGQYDVLVVASDRTLRLLAAQCPGFGDLTHRVEVVRPPEGLDVLARATAMGRVG